MTLQRHRPVYLIWMALVVVLGLGSRSSLAVHLPNWIASYAGDTLWSLNLFLFLGFLFPRVGILTLGAIALGGSFAIEVSQLYQADWAKAIRATRPGALLLGHGFLWSDLVCYTVGVLIGVVAEWLTYSRGPKDSAVSNP